MRKDCIVQEKFIPKEAVIINNVYDPAKPYKHRILQLIKQTWKTPYVAVQDGVYPIFKKKISAYEIDHTDAIGTKGVYHWQKRTFNNAVLDALAMNLNDLALVRAIPFKLQNHIVLPEDDHAAVVKIVTQLARTCKQRHIAMTGGETSIQNTSQGMDLSLTVSGFVKEIKPNRFKRGDILIGLPSNGLHSNGFSKVRQLFGDAAKSEFIKPTRIYLDQVLELEERITINGMMHITGGAFTKLKDVLHNVDVIIHKDHSVRPQPIFKEIYERGVSDEDMYRTFNCGIGFVLSVAKRDAARVIQKTKGESIGAIVAGRGNVMIASQFSNKTLKY